MTVSSTAPSALASTAIGLPASLPLLDGEPGPRWLPLPESAGGEAARGGEVRPVPFSAAFPPPFRGL